MKEVFTYTHTHWDREWYREFEEFRLRLIEVTDRVLDELENQRLDCFYFDGQTAALEDYLEIYPEKYPVIKKLIEQKKLYTGPFYCSPDVFLVNSESLIRNLCCGIKKSKEWGCADFIAYLADTFGYSKGIISILNAFGIENIVMWRGLGDLPSEFLWKQSKKSSAQLKAVNLIRGYFQDCLSLDVSDEKKAELLKDVLDKIAEKSSNCLLLPIGADHLAPPVNLNKTVQSINNYIADYKIHLSNPFEYLKNVENNYKIEVTGELTDNSKTFILPGVYSSRIYLKQYNSRLQWLLASIAEPIAAFAFLNGHSKSYQNECDYAFKNFIKNHAHDSIYGCSTDKVHDAMVTRFKDIEDVANGVIKRVLRDLSNDGKTLSVINLSNFSYSGAVKIVTDKSVPAFYKPQLIKKYKHISDKKLYSIEQIPVTEDITEIKEYLIDVTAIDSFSFVRLEEHHIVSKKSSLKITNNSIENVNISLSVKSGKICVTDKKTGQIYDDFISIIDKADIGDSYNYGALKGQTALKAQLVKSCIIRKGPIQSVLGLCFVLKIPKTSSKGGRSKKTAVNKFNVEVTLTNQSSFLEFSVDWINKAQNHLLQVSFKLPEKITATTSEDTVGLIERQFDPNYEILEYVPAVKGVELKTNTAPMQRFVHAQNCGIITKGLHEYEISKNHLLLTILRSTGTISNPKNPSRGTPAGPPLATPGLQCLGPNKVQFGLGFTAEPADLYRFSEEFYNTCIPVFSTLEPVNFLNLNNKNILVQAFKLDRDKNLVVRLCNQSSSVQKCKIDAKPDYKKIRLSSPEEFDVKEVGNDITLLPNEIITLKFVFVVE